MKLHSFSKLLWLSAVSLFLSAASAYGSENPASQRPWKVLHVMSYHQPWEWTDSMLNGFKEPLKDLAVEYRVFQMDTKRQNSPEWKERKGKEARDLIDAWKPDLVYLTDDDAQEYVTRHYVDRQTPFVFSGVNAAPETYGFSGSRNITGVLEQEHFVETVRLLKEIVPAVETIAVILDRDPMWGPVAARMKAKMAQVPQVRFQAWETIDTFSGFRQKMADLQGQVDAVALLGIFGFKDESGRNVSYREVLKWTAEHSRLPDFSFWLDRISYGTLCAVTVSGFEQGLAAGKKARAILKDGQRPSELPMNASVRGEPVISLARAKRLGIDVKSGALLSSRVVEQFEWEK